MDKSDVGRPTKYKPEYCDMIIDLGKQGKSLKQIASSFDVHIDSLYEWQKVYPEFSEAITRAKQEAQVWWEDMGQAGLTMNVFNSSLWAKQVSCRFPADYREVTRQENQQLDKNGKPSDGFIFKIERYDVK